MKKNIFCFAITLLLFANAMNAQDYAAKVPHPTKGKAAIVHFYMGTDIEKDWVNLFQSFGTPIANIFDGYDYKILLKHDSKFGGLELDQKAVDAANKVDIPTEANLFKYVKQLTEDGYSIDLFILSHGSSGKFLVSTGTKGSEGWCTKEDIETNLGPAGSHFSFIPFRMVYQLQCYGQSLNETWKNLGAKAVNGSTAVNFYPNQLKKFVDEWNQGSTSFSSAITNSNTSSSRTVVQDWLAYVRAPICKLKSACTGQWNGCPVGKTILGDNDCAKEFFISSCCGYFSSSEWHNGHSGKENMDFASQQYLSGGNKNITKNSTAKWE